MINKSYSAPTGSGIRILCVAPAAREFMLGRTGKIVVLVSVPEFAINWEKALPEAEMMTIQQFRRSGLRDDTALVIVEELHDYIFRSIAQTLDRIDPEVWLINRELPAGPVIKFNPDAIIRGNNLQLDAYKLLTSGLSTHEQPMLLPLDSPAVAEGETAQLDGGGSGPGDGSSW